MFARVVHGVRRRSHSEPHEEPQPQPRSSIPGEHIPPRLVRWSDFKDPFPALSPGAYRKYYMVYGSASMDDPLTHNPRLSCTSEPSSPSISLEKSALFPTKIPISPPRLTIIHEASLETMHARRRVEPPSTSSERSPPNSLRRRRRQVLRTPSVERDFGGIARLVFTHDQPSEDIKFIGYDNQSPESTTSHSSCETSSTTTHTSHCSVPAIARAPLSLICTATSQSSHSSTDSDNSDTSPSDSDLVITPLTSLSDVREDPDDPQKEAIHAFVPRERPDSWCSFSTAKTDFCDI